MPRGIQLSITIDVSKYLGKFMCEIAEWPYTYLTSRYIANKLFNKKRDLFRNSHYYDYHEQILAKQRKLKINFNCHVLTTKKLNVKLIPKYQISLP